MPRINRKALVAIVAACTVYASAQTASSQTEVSNSTTTSSSPAAYVYVSNFINNSNTAQVNGYAAASNGSLTPIPGSPFPDNVGRMALNGKWLFGAEIYPAFRAPSVIYSLAIAPNGALTNRDAINTTLSGGSITALFLDHTGSTLYGAYDVSNSNDYLGYSINQSTGKLTNISDLPGNVYDNTPLSFTGNNQFAYSSGCYQFAPSIYGVQRAPGGALSFLNINPPYPPAPAGDYYCPWLAAADPTNHLAIAMQPLNSNWMSAGPTQLATYTVDSFGDLTTTSTAANMPKVLVGNVTDYKMSPNGKYLAVGGSAGVQFFHFNGANPITPFTGLLPTAGQVDTVFWDNANHLYALSPQAGKLYVYGGNSTGVTQAPGSPYSIPNALDLIVLPETQQTTGGSLRNPPVQ